MRQENNPEVVCGRPVKTRALHQQNLGFLQHFLDELLVIGDRVHLRVKLGEHVQGSARLDASHARNGGDQFMRQIALTTQASARTHKVVDALVAAQRGLNRPLAGNVGTQTHAREHVQTFDVITGPLFVTRDRHPASPVAAGAVTL